MKYGEMLDFSSKNKENICRVSERLVWVFGIEI